MKTFLFRQATGALLVMTAVTSVYAATVADDSSKGTVNFTGKIVDIPCTISGDGGNVDVDMQTVSTGAVMDGSAPKVPFSIKLSDCSTAIKKTVQTTFSGTDAGGGQIALSKGDSPAQNVAIQLFQNGKELKLDTPSDEVPLTQGDSEIPFAAQYVNYNKTQPVAGNGNAVAQFTLSYQ